MKETVSHHMFRRTARAKERELQKRYPGCGYKVVSMVRGPWGWRVVRTH